MISLYYEAYQNVFDKQERRNLAQIITDTIYQRPRIDLSADYFVSTYQLEIACLYRRLQILKTLTERIVKFRETL